MSSPSVSVVVAAWRDSAGLEACLQALAGQRDQTLEVLVPGNGEAPEEILVRFPWARWLAAPAGDLTPRLWARGIAAARGDLVALTTAHFVAAPDWIERLRAACVAHPEAAGVGGRIEPPRGGSLVDWATYFQRYGGYLALDAPGPVPDIAADNACYDGRALAAHAAELPDGFWEPEFHRLVLAEGRSLRFEPRARVTMARSFGLSRFCGQRLHHGHRYGADRMAAASLSRRLLGLLSAPLIPAVLLVRLVRRSLAAGRHRGAFAACLPVLVLFILCWSLGEAWGYLTPRPDRGEPARSPPT